MKEHKGMPKGLFKKVLLLGRASVFTAGLSLSLALTFGATSSAGAHTGSAGLFHLGHWNPVTALSGLYGAVANPILYLSNSSTDSKATTLTAYNKSVAAAAVTAANTGGGPALRLSVASGKAPMIVSAGAAKVANLDSDKLDGKDSTEFAAGTSGKANDTDKVDGIDSTAFFSQRQVVENTVTARTNGVDYYDSTLVTATCPSGKSALGGGYYVGTVSTAVVVSYSRPTSDGTGWEIYVHNGTSYNISATAYVICAVASG